MEKEEYLDLFYQMVLIRHIEESAAQLYQQGKIGGFLHLYIGQEAVSTGLISARQPQGRVITASRIVAMSFCEPRSCIGRLSS